MQIYTITLVEDIIKDKELGWIDNTRIVGWFPKFQMAEKAVLENKCDIQECLYKYIIIEECHSGVYSVSSNEWWYKWNTKKRKFEKLEEKPSLTKHLINFGIG